MTDATDPQAIDLHVRFEQVRALYGHLPASALGSLMGVVGCSVLFGDLVDGTIIAVWTAFGAIAILFGMLLYFWHQLALRGLAARAPDHVGYLLYVVMSGTLWGAAGWLFFFPNEMPYTLCLIAGFCAYFGAAIVVAASYLPAVILFFLMVGSPLMLRMALEQQFVWTALASMGVVYVGVLTIVARRLNKTLVQAWRLGVLHRDSEARLRQSYDSLERQIEQRTAALVATNEQLRTQISGRERAESALQLTEARLSDAIESLEGGFALYDSDDVLVMCNKAYRRFIDFSHDEPDRAWTFQELLEERVRRGYIPAAKGQEEAWLKRRLALHRANQGLTEFVESGGTYYQVVEQPTLDSGTVCFVIDITDVKARERELAQQSGYLSAILTNVSQGVCLFNADRRLVAANDRYLELIQLPSTLSRPGTHLKDIIEYNAKRGRLGEGPVDEVIRRQNALFSSKNGSRQERVREDGVVLEMVTSPTGDGGFVATFTDITAHRHREQILRENEERFRTIVEAIPIPVVVVRYKDDEIIFENSLLGPLFGLKPGEMAGRRSRDFVTNADDLERAIDRLKTEGFAIDVEVMGRRIDGTEFPGRLSSKRTVYQGETAVVSGLVDLTDIRLTEESLRQAQKMEAVGQLTGGVAHDFNNLLAIITGCLELASEDLAPESVPQELVSQALFAAQRGATLTQRLLAFSRKQPLNPRVIDLRTLLTSMKELIERTLGETIDVEIEAMPDLWMCHADPAQLENAVLNLAINGRDAMPDGGRLTLGVRNQEVSEDGEINDLASGEYVLLSVTDTGSGMSDTVVSRAAEPFFTTKDVGKGSGLGLSMVYGFVAQSGGTLTIDSAPGLGTNISIYLPRVVASAETASRETDAARPPGSGDGELILVVEDDPDVRKLIVGQLRSLNYRSVDVSTAADAVALLDDGLDADLILSDIVLPGGMSGFDLAAVMEERNASQKIAFMSGYAPTHLRDSATGQYRSEWLEKPFRKEDLARYIHKALEKDETLAAE